MHFCGLGYSRPDGQTSDHWTDVERLTWEPEFHRYVRDAFAPVGLMIDAWAEEYPAGQAARVPRRRHQRPVRDWQGDGPIPPAARGDKIVQEKIRPCRGAGVGRRTLTFRGRHSRRGRDDTSSRRRSIGAGAEPVRSLRDFERDDRGRAAGPARPGRGQAGQASSNIAKDGATSPAAAVDGRSDTRWSSEFSDPQWIAVDLGRSSASPAWCSTGKRPTPRPTRSRFRSTARRGRRCTGPETARAGRRRSASRPTEARWVRMTGTQRATEFGYSLWEMRVFKE